MATPRRPEEPRKMGFGGLFFVLLILGGAIWLLMLVFGWGPYKTTLTETPTATQTQMGASLAPSQATATVTITPTGTHEPSATATMTQTPTDEPMPFILFGDPETLSSDLLLPNLGCNWLVIAGQVWDLKGEPVVGLTLHLFGTLGGVEIDQQVISGSATTYGESGYEFRMEGLVMDSHDTLYLQLVDTSGLPLSRAYGLQTYDDCQKNMILINMKQVR